MLIKLLRSQGFCTDGRVTGNKQLFVLGLTQKDNKYEGITLLKQWHTMYINIGASIKTISKYNSYNSWYL